MIVTCENCDTRFNLDESLVKESGSKVRCSKCHHIFTVHKLVPVEEPDSALEEVPADLPDTAEAPEEVLDFDLLEAEEEAAEEEGAEEEISLEEFGLEEELAVEEPAPIEEGVAVKEAPEAVEEAPEEVLDFDLLEAEEEGAEEEISLEEFGLEEELAVEEPAPIEEGVAVKEAPEAVEEAPEEVLDFDLLEAEEEGAEEEISLEEFGLEEELAAEEPAPEEVLDFGLPGAEEEGAEEEISLEEFGLEEEPAAEEPAPIEEEIVFEEAPEAVEAEPLIQEAGAKEGPEEGEAEQVEEELMPPPVAEKKPRARKRISTPLMIVLVLVLLAGGAFGAYTLLKSLDIKIPFLESLIGAPESATVDPGNLRIAALEQLIKTEFAENRTTGRLFVIKGKVRNDYPEARNFIMVRGVVYSKDGKAVQEKTVYCGNTLSDTDLQALDKATIETRLSNRFGDKRSNFRVPSGKAIPFVVVFSDLPQDLGEFSVEVVSSSSG